MLSKPVLARPPPVPDSLPAATTAGAVVLVGETEVSEVAGVLGLVVSVGLDGRVGLVVSVGFVVFVPQKNHLSIVVSWWWLFSVDFRSFQGAFAARGPSCPGCTR